MKVSTGGNTFIRKSNGRNFLVEKCSCIQFSVFMPLLLAIRYLFLFVSLKLLNKRYFILDLRGQGHL